MHTFANLPLETSRVADTNCSTQQAVATYGFAAGALASNADELTDVAQPHGNEVEFLDGMARVEYLAAVTAAIDNAAGKPALVFLDRPSDMTQLGARLPPPSTSAYCQALHCDLSKSAQVCNDLKRRETM